MDHILAPASSAPRTSVVIPCFNSARWIEAAIASVLDQSDPDIELIVVDDGSSDDTVSVARTFISCRCDPRARVISKRNGGLADARNHGIRSARGRFVLPLDADDLLDPSMILVCADALDTDTTLHVAFVDRVDFGDVVGRHTAGEFTVEHLRYFNQISYCSLVRRDAWRAVGGYRTNVSGFDDWDFWLALALAGYRGIHIVQPLFLHRRRRDSQMWSVLPRYEEIFAKMVLNNVTAYSEADVEAARTMLASGTPFQRARMSKFIFVGRYYRDYPRPAEVQ